MLRILSVKGSLGKNDTTFCLLKDATFFLLFCVGDQVQIHDLDVRVRILINVVKKIFKKTSDKI
jgi:hypothetical protein